MTETEKPKFIPIPLDTLQINTDKNFDVFIKTKKGKMVLYSAGRESFSLKVRDNLIEHGISILYISEKDIGLYNSYLSENLSEQLSNPNAPTQDKAEFAYTTIANIGRNLFAKPTAETIDSYKNAISKTVDFVLKEDDSVAHLINMTQFDFTTYNHSMNVGIFATGLTKALFANNDKHNLEELASGFFLHDLGKSGIPLKILRKPGPLDSEEWGIMKTHPTLGFDILTKFDKITPESKIIVVQHHERHNGTGYPNGVRGKNIHIYSKICCIADVFEALVAKRPYKKQKSFFEALKIMQGQMKDDFDPVIFKKFVLLFTNQKVKAKFV